MISQEEMRSFANIVYQMNLNDDIQDNLIKIVQAHTECVCGQCEGEWKGNEMENHKFDCPTGKGGGGLTLASLSDRLTKYQLAMVKVITNFENRIKEIQNGISTGKQTPTNRPW